MLKSMTMHHIRFLDPTKSDGMDYHYHDLITNKHKESYAYTLCHESTCSTLSSTFTLLLNQFPNYYN